MSKKDSLLLIIDVQERLAPKMAASREVITNCTRLVEVAKVLDIPFLITEQYPKGLGPTVFDIKNAAGEAGQYFDKLSFSCAADPAIMKKIKTSKKTQIVLAGIETHICVLQTALGLKDAGYEVFVLIDACSSREEVEGVFAIERLLKNNVEVVTSEMAIFEWLEKSGTEAFKHISQKYIK